MLTQPKPKQKIKTTNRQKTDCRDGEQRGKNIAEKNIE